MYLKVNLKQNIFLPSQSFTKDYKKIILSSLLLTVEGKKFGPHGQVIFVTEISQKNKNGKILIGSSSALFSISYVGISLKLFKGEVLDSVVSVITEFGFFCEVGNIQIFVSRRFLPAQYHFDSDNCNFFIPSNSSREIKRDVKLRVRVIGIKQDNDFNQALGTINENVLGVIIC